MPWKPPSRRFSVSEPDPGTAARQAEILIAADLFQHSPSAQRRNAKGHPDRVASISLDTEIRRRRHARQCDPGEPRRPRPAETVSVRTRPVVPPLSSRSVSPAPHQRATRQSGTGGTVLWSNAAFLPPTQSPNRALLAAAFDSTPEHTATRLFNDQRTLHSCSVHISNTIAPRSNPSLFAAACPVRPRPA